MYLYTQCWGDRDRQITAFKASLVDRASSKTAGTTQRNPVKEEERMGGRRGGGEEEEEEKKKNLKFLKF